MRYQITLKLISLVIIALLGATTTIAQKAPIKYGKISKDELIMKRYEKDTSAVAVYLCDYGVGNFNYNISERAWRYQFTRTYRIKILKDEGLDYGNLEFGFNKNRYKVASVKGCTYNLENGKIVKSKISSKDRILEKTTKNYFTYKLALANVKPGSVIEFSYQLTSDIPWNLGPWYFQKDIPVIWSEFRASIPEYFDYKQNAKGYLAFDINSHEYTNGNIGKSSYTVDEYRFAVKDAPAFKKEPYTTTSRNYTSAIEFEIARTKDNYGVYRNMTNNWKKINESLLKSENFGFQLKSGGFLKETVETINANASTDEEKLMAAFNFIKSSMKWNERNGKYTTNTLKSAFKDKKGNVADINIMLVVLLNKLGLQADPVILSTRSNGKLNLFAPSLSKFNYVIASCQMGEERIFLDATESNCPRNLLPARCINDKGRVIRKDGSFFVDIKTKSISKTVTMAKMNLDEEGLLAGELKISLAGFAALQFRDGYEDKTDDQILESMDESYKTLNVESAEIINLKDSEKNIVSKLEVEMAEEIESENNLIYFNPFIVNKMKSNPFTLEERKYPVDYTYPADKTFLLELTVPDGYVIESKPAPAIINLPEKAAQFLYSVAQDGNKIQVTSRFKINKRQFSYNEYPYLKEFYNRVVAKNAEMIVIKKI